MVDEGVDERVAAGLLPRELEEQIGLAVVRLRLLDVRPVVELGVGETEEGLRVIDGEAVLLLAELRVSLLEPDR